MLLWSGWLEVSWDTMARAEVMWWMSANPAITTLRRTAPVKVVQLLGFDCHC